MNLHRADGELRLEMRYAMLRDLRVDCEGHSDPVPVHPPDFSSRGMFINTPQTFPEGTVLRLSFRLTCTDCEVAARAEVRYCLPGVGVGVEFIGLDAVARRAIERELSLYGRIQRRTNGLAKTVGAAN